MKGKAVVHSKGKDDWQTPQWLFDRYDKILNFGLDAAASDENALCNSWFTEENDALKQSWKGYGNVFVNPPYSKNKQFLKHIVGELDGTFNIIVLVPSRTSNNWWHDYVIPVVMEIHFIKNRVQFVGAKSGAPFPSCILVYKNPAGCRVGAPAMYTLEQPEKSKYGRDKSASNSSSTSDCSSAKV